MERDPGKSPNLEGDDLFGDSEEVDHSVEEGVDAQLQAEDDDED